jgi:alkylhydroperoxidase family enzyme
MAPRMPIVKREELSPKDQAAFDEVAGIRGRAPEVGPSSVMIHNPEMAAQVNRLSAFLMAETEIPEKFRRLGALIAARSIDCRYVWNAHAATACASTLRAGPSATSALVRRRCRSRGSIRTRNGSAVRRP